MKVITEQILRLELRNSEPTEYIIEDGKLLSPAAREYLQQRKIKIYKQGEKEKKLEKQEKVVKTNLETIVVEDDKNVAVYKYVDYYTGAFYLKKPENMTHIHGNVLVCKNHPRIAFRGKVDSLQSLIVLCQCELKERELNSVIEDLNDILIATRSIMYADVMDTLLQEGTIIGLTHEQLRDHSHHPQKYYNVKQMQLPDYTMGKPYALLNQIRTAIRECEVASADAFFENGICKRSDIVQQLNRLSSALHIMMCKYLAGSYK